MGRFHAEDVGVRGADECDGRYALSPPIPGFAEGKVRDP